MDAHRELLAVLLVIYFIVMLGIGAWAQGRIHDSEDYLVAGRRLPLLLAWPTLLATWFGAGALLTSTDQIRREGLRMAALDPFGAGLCLLLAGWWLARPLWHMKLLTLGDFFRRRFGPRAEVATSLMMVPTYFGWIAAQFVALAELFQLVFGLDRNLGIAGIALLGTTYTLLGGMWSVTLTDVVQMACIVVGLLFLAGEVLVALGGGVVGGLEALWTAVPPERWVLVPHESGAEVLAWLGVLAVGSLGNLPGQDLLQRVFASRSADTAVRACHLAGVTYLVLGTMPILLGLAADVLAPGQEQRSTLGVLATLFLSPLSGSMLMLAVVSAVFSTIDSAILSPASLISENVLPKIVPASISSLTLNRVSVLAVALAACVTAYLGESAYGMLEDAYALAMVSLLVPLLAGLWWQRGGEGAAFAAMIAGTGSWVAHEVAGWETFLGAWAPFGWELPVALSCTLLSALAFGLAVGRPQDGSPSDDAGTTPPS